MEFQNSRQIIWIWNRILIKSINRFICFVINSLIHKNAYKKIYDIYYIEKI